METSFPTNELIPINIPKATNGNKTDNNVCVDFFILNAPAADVQRPIIKLAQNNEMNGAAFRVSIPTFCFK